MKSLGKCNCGSPIVESTYKLKDGINQFKRVFRCKEKISHTHSEDELQIFDLGWHKKQTDLMISC